MTTKIATAEQAIQHATETGSDDGETLYSENHEGYRSESHAISGLGVCASEAASVLSVPQKFYAAWVDAYETAARKTILRLYREANA